MQAESMVHALEQVHDLLKDGGFLIDIHPDGEKVEFLCDLDGQEQLIGYLEENDDYIEYRQADDAIQTAVSKKLFKILKAGAFEFRTYADSFDEMKTFLEENWSDAVVTEDVILRAGELESEHRTYKTILREQAKIGLLKRI